MLVDHRVSIQPLKPLELRKSVSDQEAREAIKVLIRWIGEDERREGLRDTPDRVLRSYREYFKGYQESPVDVLSRTFEDIDGYDQPVIVRNITFFSHCEHHFSPMIGKAHIAYLPDQRVVGLSKLSRVVKMFANRLQIQERLTAEVAQAIQTVLKPKGVIVLVEAEHFCVKTRGVEIHDSSMMTTYATGIYRDHPESQREILSLMRVCRP
jgi:GTP cyclohydrolase I